MRLFPLLAVLALESCRREPGDAVPPPGRDAQALWLPTTQLGAARTSHSATLLTNGKVLIAGGADPADVRTAELFDPAASTWAPAGLLLTKRRSHQAVLLPSGKVLIVGGAGAIGNLLSAELYDPATNAWSSAGSTVVSRLSHTATLLANGKVLVSGGYGAPASAELYDPAANAWTTGGMTAPRFFATATLLPSGKVLVAGGLVQGVVSATAELYDPVANSWAAAASLGVARQHHSAALLSTGKVLVAGGAGPLSSAELYDPATNTWAPAGPMTSTRALHTSTSLASGKVLVTGGSAPPTASTEVYDPATDTWTAAGLMTTARSKHTATRLPGGKVLVAGGENSAPLPWAELYEPTVGGTACSSAAACPSGFCVDGLCCDTACSGDCDSCDLPASPGVCTAAPAGASGNPSCAPYACRGASASCPSVCALDFECAVGNWCSAGGCVLQLPRGAACNAANQCSTGSCSDGRCCDSACSGPCDTCTAAGTCVVTLSGVQGNPSCAPFVCRGAATCPLSCATEVDCVSTSFCDAGACVPRTPTGGPCTLGAQCATFNCVDGVCCDKSCSGQCDTCNQPGSVGTCVFRDAGAGGNPTCSPYACTGATALCPTRCTTNTDCGLNFRCADAGMCRPSLGVGAACAVNSDCGQRGCVDGVCCSTPCADSCDACNLPGSVGTCAASPAGIIGSPSCSPYLCQGASTCPASCSAHSQCGSDFFCSDGGCVDKTPKGTPCTSSSTCASGFCADGFCCGTACTSGCNVCDVTPGTCTPIAEGAEGTPSCAPYLCAAGGKCYGTCTSNSHCVSPNFCSGGFCTSKPVGGSPAPGQKGCGCQAAGGPAALLAGLLLWARRRQR